MKAWISLLIYSFYIFLRFKATNNILFWLLWSIWNCPNILKNRHRNFNQAVFSREIYQQITFGRMYIMVYEIYIIIQLKCQKTNFLYSSASWAISSRLLSFLSLSTFSFRSNSFSFSFICIIHTINKEQIPYQSHSIRVSFIIIKQPNY